LDGRPKSNALRLENEISFKNTSVVMLLSYQFTIKLVPRASPSEIGRGEKIHKGGSGGEKKD